MKFTSDPAHGLLSEAVVVHVLLEPVVFAAADGWSRSKDTAVIAPFVEALTAMEDDDGIVVGLAPERLVVAFDGDALAAVHAATNMQEWLASRGGASRVGVGAGSLRSFVLSPSHRQSGPDHKFILGPAASRAKALAEFAKPGAILIDSAVVADLAVEYLHSTAGTAKSWSGLDYLGRIDEIRSQPDRPPIAFNEFLWDGRSFQYSVARQGPVADPSEPPRRVHGVIGRMPGRGDFGVINSTAGDDASFVFDMKAVIDDGSLAAGSNVVFIAGSPSQENGLPRAHAVVRVGAQLVGVVDKVFESRHYAFVEVRDDDDVFQYLFLHADDNQWPVEPGDRVSFIAGENRQGATVVSGVVVD
jgi:hypothetical protein